MLRSHLCADRGFAGFREAGKSQKYEPYVLIKFVYEDTTLTNCDVSHILVHTQVR
jgi:hypothetical protein